MPPKRVQDPPLMIPEPLTMPEQLLLRIASRIDTAIRYKDAHPNGDYTHWMDRLTQEMKQVGSVYTQYPETSTLQHRIHSSIAVAVNEWRRAVDAKRMPDLRQLTVKAIDRAFQSSASKYPDWPAIFRSRSLEERAMAQPPQMHWWIQGGPSGDGDDGRRQSKRLNKGKAPAPPDADMDVDNPGRSRKRTAERAVEADEEMDNAKDGSDGEPTPRKGNTSVNHPTFDVIISSPPNPRPKQRFRVNEAGDAVDPPVVLQQTKRGVWVGRGKDRCTECVKGKQKTCVPQWGAVKPSKACAYCAIKKKECVPTDKAIEMMKALRPEWALGGRKPAPKVVVTPSTSAAAIVDDTHNSPVARTSSSAAGAFTRQAAQVNAAPSTSAAITSPTRHTLVASTSLSAAGASTRSLHGQTDAGIGPDPQTAVEREPTNQELKNAIIELSGVLQRNTNIIMALCSGLGFEIPTTDAPSTFMMPLYTASPLDSPVIALGNLSLGGASQASRTSSVNSSAKSSGNSAVHGRPLGSGSASQTASKGKGKAPAS